ncbi:hypothetical protein ACFYT4_25460 [Streptomyces sp. NPDC004609]|uniref:hypothetical protein n=1 Tax=Streptomyces sp. NPDC004609 TaxID=3364704 RepID=UPI00369BE580
MTHSGQGDERRQPAARPAHEGVVLPADGSDPLIPGPPGAEPPAAPAGGRPWGEPWGLHEPVQGAPQAHGDGWGEEPRHGYGVRSQPLPEAQPSPGLPGALPPQAPPPDGRFGGAGEASTAGPGAGQSYGLPLPGAGQAPRAGADGVPPPDLPGVLPPQAAPHGDGVYGAYGSAGAGQPSYGGGFPGTDAWPPPEPYGRPQAMPDGVSAGVPLPQQGTAAYSTTDATQFIPPVVAAEPVGAADATQFIPPVGAADVTQHIPPVPQPGSPAAATAFPGSGPLPGAGAGGGPLAPEAATQFLPPVPAGPAAPAPMAGPPGAAPGMRPGAPGERQPPAEFDSLFRTDAAPGGAQPGPHRADPTQQMPRIDGGPQQVGLQPAGYQQHQRPPQYDRHDAEAREEREERRRNSSQLAVMAAVVVACAVLGLGVSAALFSGGDDDKKDDSARKNVAASSPAPSAAEPVQPAAQDPVKTQAKALDKLLADSNDSRAAVIRSVENIKKCKDLDQAADDLRGAAEQRRGLVTRLGELSIDKLPRSADLSASLVDAWQSSAKADDHYAAWATQVKGKKGCKDGRARTTRQTVHATRASGDATKAKREASGLWNSIAAKYQLTERRSEQL